MHPLLDSQNRPLYVLRRISDKFVLNSRAISNTTGAPNPGPDQEYLPILTDDLVNNDPVYTIATKTEATDEAAKQVKITFPVTDRPLEEKLAAADNAARFEAQKHVSLNDKLIRDTLLLAAAFREIKGLAITPKEEALVLELMNEANAINKNDDNLAAIKAAIVAGQKPDLTSGWEAVAAVVPVVP